MEPLPVCLAVIFQLLGYSFFIKQPEDQCSPAPPFGSWLFLLATHCYLLDISIYPGRFMDMPLHWQLIIEMVASVFLGEIFTLIIWCGVERVVYMLTSQLINTFKLNDYCSKDLDYWLHGLTSVAVGGAMLWFILEATDSFYYLTNFMRKLGRNWQHFWRILYRICRMSKDDRRRTFKAMFPSRRHSCDEVDDVEDD